MNPEKSTQRGFTLVEIIVVLVIIGVLAGTMVMFVRPAFQSYLAVGRRAGLTNQADTALRLMTREIRAAVPNSIRLVGTTCAEFVPTIDGGRFRTAPDTAWDTSNTANLSEPLELGNPDRVFDVLTPFSTIPGPDDIVVIGNQNTDDVYTNSTPAFIENVVTSSNAATERAIYRHRITLRAPATFPAGYEGGRFVIVPATARAVTYQCDLANGVLRRRSGYVPQAAPSCTPNVPIPPSGTTVTNTVATRVTGCQFTYYPNQGATQESGYLEIQLRLTDGGESVMLNHGVHVDNIP